MMDKSFSVLIPAYKSRYLKEAIESVLAQTYQYWELIIVDDNSPNDLWKIVQEFKDNRISYYRNERSFGACDVVYNWNKCLSYAKGDYVICMGDDDCLLPCCLDEYVKLINKYPALNVYHAKTQLIDEDSNMFFSKNQGRSMKRLIQCYIIYGFISVFNLLVIFSLKKIG